MRKINENIAYAKSILNKNGITPDSEEYQDYLKIREICGGSNGYVGILTKIRFVDEVTDMDEIESIFNVLKNSKIDINKLNKMSYSQILDIFYNEFSENEKDEDLELIYKDSQYSYFRVYTYKGILRIGSPAWCLKTKSNWDRYTNNGKYHQWVVVDNRYLRNLITPENNYLLSYHSTKGWIRFGVTMNHERLISGEEGKTFVAFSDDNNTMRWSPVSYTFFGVLYTIVNLEFGIKKSWYNHLPGCEKLEGTKAWLKVTDKNRVCHIFQLPDGYFDDQDEIYIACSQTYSSTPVFICLNEKTPIGYFPVNNNKLNFAHLSGAVSRKILEDYALKSDNTLYYGVKLKLGQITEQDVESHEKFIKRIGNWFIFDHNKGWYKVVNAAPKRYELPTQSKNSKCWEMGHPLYFYVKKDMSSSELVYNTNREDWEGYATEVISYLKELNKPVEEPKPQTEPEVNPEEKKVRGFWDFLKRKK